VDALAAAHEFRKIAPEYFHILTKCPATFCKQRDNANMVYRRPHIVVSGSSNDEIVTVNWSPPFEGPLSVRTDMVEPYYEAYAAFECMLDNKFVRNTTQQTSKLFQELADYANEYTWERKLHEGQMLVFNNRRMLHARRSFELLLEEEGATDGKVVGRHLVGCYTNIDDTLSRYRVLLRQRLSKDEAFSLLNVGNGSPAVN
jgi:gamma-butyrobetaine dioxygenase